VSGQLKSAGFGEIALHRFDQPFVFGHSLEHAVEMNLALGPAAEALRRIPAGRTTSYSSLAADLGRPTAVRAVGSVNPGICSWSTA